MMTLGRFPKGASISFTVAAILATAIASPAQTRDAARPIIVQGAMPIETDRLIAQLQGAKVEQVGGWMFWRGTIDGYPVVVSKTLKGVSSAAAATAIAVERYHPIAIINQGTAGGHDPALHLYDIVVGTSSVSIGAFRSQFRPAGRGSNPLDWRPLDLTASEGSAGNDAKARRIAHFESNSDLLAAAHSARPSYSRGRIVDGVIGSSDMWNDELDLIALYHKEYGTSVEEMETASAAHVARELNVPFLGIRIVSDNITNDSPYDPKTAEACEDFVYQVVKTYIRTHKR
jgi:adenosylhomocysteine nucleosidase